MKHEEKRQMIEKKERRVTQSSLVARCECVPSLNDAGHQVIKLWDEK